MATNVSGIALDLGARFPYPVTAGANIAADSFVNADGTVPANAADCTGGVAMADTANGDYVDVLIPPGIVRVKATGTVTKGLLVEILQASFTCNIAGVATAVTAAGVQNTSAGKIVGRALTTGVANDTVLVNLAVNSAKSA